MAYMGYMDPDILCPEKGDNLYFVELSVDQVWLIWYISPYSLIHTWYVPHVF